MKVLRTTAASKRCLTSARSFSSVQRLQISEHERSNLQQLEAYKKFIHHFEQQKYSQAASDLQECLNILKSAQQEKTLAYQWLLKRKAYTHFMDMKFGEAEFAFLNALTLGQEIAPNSEANFQVDSTNLGVLHLYKDQMSGSALQQIEANLEMIIAKKNQYSQDQGVYSFLEKEVQTKWNHLKSAALVAGGEHKEGQILLRKEAAKLRDRSDPPVELGFSMNNLAVSQLLEDSESKLISFENLRKALEVLGSSQFFPSGDDRTAGLKTLVSSDLLGEPSAAEEGALFELFEQTEDPLGQATIVLKNCSGFMLRHRWEDAKAAEPTKAFYHALALKYLEHQHRASESLIQESELPGVHELVAHHRVEIALFAHLSNMALFYATKNKFMMAEGLFRQSISMLEEKVMTPYNLSALSTARRLYGQILVQMPNREREGQRLLDDTETYLSGELSGKSNWLTSLSKLYLEGFDLE